MMMTGEERSEAKEERGEEEMRGEEGGGRPSPRTYPPQHTHDDDYSDNSHRTWQDSEMLAHRQTGHGG